MRINPDSGGRAICRRSDAGGVCAERPWRCSGRISPAQWRFAAQLPGMRPGVRSENLDRPRLGGDWSTTASQGLRQVAIQGQARPVFFARTWNDQPSRLVTLSALRCNERGDIAEVWRVEGIPDSATLEIQDPDAPVDDVLARVRVRLALNQETTLMGRDVVPGVISNQPLGGDPCMPIVARLGSGECAPSLWRRRVTTVFAIDPPAAAGTVPRVRWQRRGRGMRDGSRSLGLLAADLTGDGIDEVIAADAATAGHAVLRLPGRRRHSVGTPLFAGPWRSSRVERGCADFLVARPVSRAGDHGSLGQHASWLDALGYRPVAARD